MNCHTYKIGTNPSSIHQLSFEFRQSEEKSSKVHTVNMDHYKAALAVFVISYLAANVEGEYNFSHIPLEFDFLESLNCKM